MVEYNFLQFFTLTLLLSTAQSYQNMSSGSTLTPLGPTTHWLSPSGDFAFGFLPLDATKTTFLLAIWFAKIPSKTTVWYANGDNLVDSTAKVKLTANNQLTLYNKSGDVIWSSGSRTTTNTDHAAILDTGNLVVVSTDGSTQWQSC